MPNLAAWPGQQERRDPQPEGQGGVESELLHWMFFAIF